MMPILLMWAYAIHGRSFAFYLSLNKKWRCPLPSVTPASVACVVYSLFRSVGMASQVFICSGLRRGEGLGRQQGFWRSIRFIIVCLMMGAKSLSGAQSSPVWRTTGWVSCWLGCPAGWSHLLAGWRANAFWWLQNFLLADWCTLLAGCEAVASYVKF